MIFDTKIPYIWTISLHIWWNFFKQRAAPPPAPPYAIYILVIGPHFFQVTSLTLGLSSNFTPCYWMSSVKSGCKINLILRRTQIHISKKRASFRKNQKIGSDFTKYENKHQEKWWKRRIFVLNFGFSSGPPGTHVSTQNIAKKNHCYAAQRIWTSPFSQNRATICYECLKRSEMYVKKLVNIVPSSPVIISKKY